MISFIGVFKGTNWGMKILWVYSSYFIYNLKEISEIHIVAMFIQLPIYQFFKIMLLMNSSSCFVTCSIM